MVVEEQTEWTLNANDRCDGKACTAQAYVKAIGVGGELLFCNHHYEEAINRNDGYDKLMKFAYQIVDERERLVENKSKGDDY